VASSTIPRDLGDVTLYKAPKRRTIFSYEITFNLRTVPKWRFTTGTRGPPFNFAKSSMIANESTLLAFPNPACRIKFYIFQERRESVGGKIWYGIFFDNSPLIPLSGNFFEPFRPFEVFLCSS
jgi:hypothetical protein